MAELVTKWFCPQILFFRPYQQFASAAGNFDDTGGAADFFVSDENLGVFLVGIKRQFLFASVDNGGAGAQQQYGGGKNKCFFILVSG